MKKNLFIISDNIEFDRYWLDYKVKIFIENKIINEEYGNFYLLSENHSFDIFCINYLNDLSYKTRKVLVTNNQELLDRYDLDNLFNKRELVDNFNRYIKNNADFIIFYCKEENEYMKIAQNNNIQYINFY